MQEYLQQFLLQFVKKSQDIVLKEQVETFLEINSWGNPCKKPVYCKMLLKKFRRNSRNSNIEELLKKSVFEIAEGIQRNLKKSPKILLKECLLGIQQESEQKFLRDSFNKSPVEYLYKFQEALSNAYLAE